MHLGRAVIAKKILLLYLSRCPSKLDHYKNLVIVIFNKIGLTHPMNLWAVWVAIAQKNHHLGGIPAEVKLHHFFIELLHLGCGDADRIDTG
jgi:hypothetical protein